MDKLIGIIEKNIGTFDLFRSIDAYEIEERIVTILIKRGYVTVGNKIDADEYFALKCGNPTQIYHIAERGFNIVVDGIMYSIKLQLYFFDTDRIYSVSVSES